MNEEKAIEPPLTKESIEKILVKEQVKKKVLQQMVKLIERVAICNKHLKLQGSHDRMVIEDVLDKIPETATPGQLILKAAFKKEDMVHKAHLMFLNKSDNH